MSSPNINIVFGAATFSEYSPGERSDFLSVLEQHGVKAIDTATAYPQSEALLGELSAAKRFTVHTKAPPAFEPGSLGRQNLTRAFNKSLEDLKTDHIDIYFLHTPDEITPLEETLEAINDLYKGGAFRRFGLSNFLPEDVEKIHSIAKANGWVLPTVYQGNYNPVARRIEDTLFPVLRKLEIAFYAYSPLAGGFFAKDPNTLAKNNGAGRFDPNTPMGLAYNTMYNKPSLIAALKEWGSIAESAGITKIELAYRWVAYHSALTPMAGDGLILGASRPSQLRDTLTVLEKGPLDHGVAARASKIWATVKDDAPLDNWNSLMKPA
jgi:aryl-alcohol dehydrogenase-like predicted oxidoreductase